jgi:hypothetical protein
MWPVVKLALRATNCNGSRCEKGPEWMSVRTGEGGNGSDDTRKTHSIPTGGYVSQHLPNGVRGGYTFIVR